MMHTHPSSPATALRRLLKQKNIILISACYDALSARLVEMAGMPATFMSGFGVAATRLALPDTGLISYSELVEQGRNICNAVTIPVMGDADTGFGNPLNIRRTIDGYHRAGFACAMIEDQVMPKRCGHTAGKAVVDRAEALLRVKAAVDARERGNDILIMARTDARAPLGLEEALERCRAFIDLGADITFLEAPRSRDEMERYGQTVPGPKMANLVENGRTPLLPASDLEQMGYAIAVYPLTLLNAAVVAMQKALSHLQNGTPAPDMMDFSQLQAIVGFNDYDRAMTEFQEWASKSTSG